MAQDYAICDLSEELTAKLKKFRFRKEKTLGAVLMKIQKAKLLIDVEEEWEDTTIEEIVNEIPPQQPRYVAICYPLKHDDGRLSYPLAFVFLSPQGCNPELQMLYAGSKGKLVTAGGFTKVIEYRSIEEFTDENIQLSVRK